MLKLEEIIKLRSTPSNTINNVQHHSLTICCLVEFCVCMMMFVFMTLFNSLLCNDCWCIVGLLPTMTSVVQLGSYVPPTSLLSSIFLPNPLKDIKKEVHGNTNNNSSNLQASAMVIKKMKVAEAWNNERRKRNYEAPKPLQKENMRLVRLQEHVNAVSIMVVCVSKKIA